MVANFAVKTETAGMVMMKALRLAGVMPNSDANWLIQDITKPPQDGLKMDCLDLGRAMNTREIAAFMDKENCEPLPLENIQPFLEKFGASLPATSEDVGIALLCGTEPPEEIHSIVFFDRDAVEKHVLIFMKQLGMDCLMLEEGCASNWSKGTKIAVVRK